jgi:2-polyprenyl-6-methoxyphenol hydroxylase-like FAD-dependent oxidoreductase
MPGHSNSVQTGALIVGAGPAGLVLACELARRGVDFRLIERREEQLIAVRGKGVQPRTLEIFEDLGILSEIIGVSGPYPNRRFLKGRQILSERPFNLQIEPTEDLPFPNMLMVPQWRTEAILRARLTTLGARVHGGESLRQFTQDESGIVATVDGPDGPFDVQAQFLVGTDGGRSTVRTAIGVEFPGKVLEGRRFLFGDVELEGLDRDAWFVWPQEGAHLTLCPIPHTDMFQLVVALRPDEEPALDDASIAALIHDRTGLDDLRLRSTIWHSISVPNLRLAERYRVGRVVLAGDAAHVHPPQGGQGLNTSIQDAYNLGWKLALTLQGASRTLLDSYEAERRPIARSMLDLVDDLAGKAAESQSRGRATQQLDLNYRGSPLSPAWSDMSGDLRAGDRAPDARYVATDGRDARLFEAFQGPHFTLLLFGDTPEPGNLDRSLVHTVRLPASANVYGVKGSASVLVRPDNYIAVVDSTGTAALVEKWFDTCIAN